MNDVTQILDAVANGNQQAVNELFPLVYNELRKMASQQMMNEKSGQTLQPTALVHEAFMRMVGSNQKALANRRYFFAAAAESMRRILIEQARRKLRIKHGGNLESQQVSNNELPIRSTIDLAELVAVHDALDQLSIISPRRAELVKLRYFLGNTVAEAAAVLDISVATAEEDWRYAKAWLYQQLHPSL